MNHGVEKLMLNAMKVQVQNPNSFRQQRRKVTFFLQLSYLKHSALSVSATNMLPTYEI